MSQSNQIHLNNHTYRIVRPLGSGAVSMVFEIEIDDLGVESQNALVAKFVNNKGGDEFKKLEGLRNEAATLQKINQKEVAGWPTTTSPFERIQLANQSRLDRLIIAHIDDGEAQLSTPLQDVSNISNNYCVIQEMAPPALERFDLYTISDELKLTKLLHLMARSMAIAHNQGVALKDFQPPHKLDRLRAEEIGGNGIDFKIIDWNASGGRADFEQDLVYLGGHLFYLMFGANLPFDRQGLPPSNLETFGEGWGQASDGLKLILTKLLDRDESQRYQRAELLEADAKWWLETLMMAERSNPIPALQDKIWSIRQNKDYTKVIAGAKLALQIDPNHESARMFNAWLEQAEAEVSKRLLIPIQSGRSSILIGDYAKAVRNFDTILANFEEQSETARLVRLYRAQARVGQSLKDQTGGGDIRDRFDWKKIESAINLLREKRWYQAKQALGEAQAENKGINIFTGYQELTNLIEAGLLALEGQKIMRSAKAPAPSNGDWGNVEKENLERLKKAHVIIGQAADLAPNEPSIQELKRVLNGLIEERENQYVINERAEQLLHEAEKAQEAGRSALNVRNFEIAASHFDKSAQQHQILDEILSPHESMLRLAYLHRRSQTQVSVTQSRLSETETNLQARENHQLALAEIEKGNYDLAYDAINKALASDPHIDGGITTQDLTARGQRYMEQKLTILKSLRSSVEMQTIDQSRLIEIQNELPTLERTPEQFPDFVFSPTLLDMTRDLANQIQRRLNGFKQMDAIRMTIKQEFEVAEYRKIFDKLNELEQHANIPLDHELETYRQQAGEYVAALNKVHAIQKNVNVSIDEIEHGLALIYGNTTLEAAGFREWARERWLELSYTMTSLGQQEATFKRGLTDFEGDIDFSNGVEIVQVAIRVDQALPSQVDLPNWFGQRDQVWSTLRSLMADFDLLSNQNKSWEQMRLWVGQKEKMLFGTFFDRYLQKRIPVVGHSLLPIKNYQAILAEIKQLQGELPDKSILPIEKNYIGLKRLVEIERIAEHLALFFELEVNWENIVIQLNKGTISFEQAYQSFNKNQIPEISQVQFEGFISYRDQLSDLVSIEKLLGIIPVAQKQNPTDLIYVDWLYEADRLKGTYSVLSQQLSRVGRILLQLDLNLKEIEQRLSQELDQEYSAIAKGYTHPPQKYLYLHWQRHWWLNHKGSPHREEIDNKLKAVIYKNIGQAIKTFSNFDQDNFLQRKPYTMLLVVEALNHGIVHTPETLTFPNQSLQPTTHFFPLLAKKP